LLSFLGISLLVIITPGQDTALTIRNTLLGGRRSGVLTAVGVAGGQTVWTVVTSAGVGALLVASAPAFVALKVAGCAYLVFLGVQMLYGVLRSHDGRALIVTEPPKVRVSPRTAVRQGLVSNLSNAKMLVFFTSLLPQFATSFSRLLVLGLTFCLLTLRWLTLYSLVVAKLGSLIRRRRVTQSIEVVTSMTLVVFGLRLATTSR
jgi:threonine/homoserine/homoserine lactone efflux protein